MKAERAILRLVERGAQIWAEGSDLAFRAPRGTIDAAARAEVRAHKAGLLRVLEATGKLALPSFAQERLWFLHKLDPTSAAYNVYLTYWLRGSLDLPALRKAFAGLAARHESLRTGFAELDGRPLQRIRPPRDPSLLTVDASSLDAGEAEALRLAEREVHRPFDLVRDELVRRVLVRLSPDRHLLILTLHHSVADAWSVGVLERELAAFYRRDTTLEELAMQYADFAHGQRRWLTGAVLDEQLGYWRRQLAELPPLELPADRSRPPRRNPSAGLLRLRLSAAGTKQLAAGLGASLFMTLLSAFMALIHRLTGQRDFAVGSPIANRNRQELEGLIGFFVNVLVLRGRFIDDMTFAGLVLSLRKVALDAYSHQDLPFEKLVDELGGDRRLDRNPLVQVLFALQNAVPDGLDLRGLETEAAGVELLQAGFDLELHFAERGGVLEGDLLYSLQLFDRTTMARLARHFENLLAQAVAHPRRRLGDLLPWTAAELHQVLQEWNDTHAPPGAGSFVELFEARAARHGESTALSTRDESVSYGELDRRADRLAGRLLALGLLPEERVALAFDRSPELIVALLAVLKAGGTYLPLDVTHPEKRLRAIVADAGARLLLTRCDLRQPLAGLGARVLAVDEEDGTALSLLRGPPHPDQAAYVLYTSGSTGAPKGVVVRHASMANLALDPVTAGEPAKVLHLVPITFDVSVWEILRALATGGSLHLAPAEDLRPGPPLERLLEERQVASAFLLPSVLSQLRPELPRPRELLTGAEVCPAPLAARWAAGGRRLRNGYGPTEATVFAAVGRLRSGSSFPIGRPVVNADLHVLDARLRPLPIGAPGGLWIGGAGLARGYLNRPRETAAGFVPHPIGHGGKRLYRSGDRARRLADGNLDFLGRLDGQVKLRGQRVELGEVESVLAAHPRVQESAVVRDAAGERLVAYVRTPPASAPTLRAELRRWLAERLPAYMVPSALVFLGSFPRLASGKVDRRALPAPADGRPDLEVEFAAPRTSEEALLAEIWADVLSVDRIGVHDNFFDLGGHSLLMNRVVSRVRESFGLELELRFLFEEPTVAELAARLGRGLRDGGGAAALPPVTATPRDGDPSYPLSFTQERFWFFDQLEPGSAAYTIAMPLRLRGPLDAGALAAALRRLAERHGVLRARFVDLGGRARQTFDGPGAALPVVDVTRLPPARREAAARRLAEADASRPFDLGKGRPFRAALVRLGEADHVFLRTWHHIVFDGWSATLFDGELQALYAAARSGRTASLAPPAIGYGDFAVWQRKHWTEELLARSVRYWRRRLGDELPSVPLTTDRPRDAERARRPAGSRSLLIPVALESRLRRFGRSASATLYMTLLAGFLALLKRYTGTEKPAVGTPVAGRHRGELEGVIGPFVNVLVLLGDLAGKPSFEEAVGRVREASLEASAHQEMPFERLVEELAPAARTGHNPLYQILFSVESAWTSEGESALEGLEASAVDFEAGEIDVEMSWIVLDERRGLRVFVDYRKTLFDATTIDRSLRHYRALLDSLVADPARGLHEAVMWSPAERQQVLREWNPPREVAAEPFLPLFKSRARTAPEAAAVSEAATGTTVTYGELDRRSGLVASTLMGRGVRTEDRVALLLERSADFVVALLAVHKAGAAYVPLDPAAPEGRLRQVLLAAGATCLLTHGRILRSRPELRSLAGSVPETLFLQAAESAVSRPLLPTPAPGGSAAYVVFTSGSSGAPKGVVVSREALDSHVSAARRLYGIAASDRILQFVSLAFDVHAGEIFPGLAAGAHLVMRDEAAADSARAFLRSCREHRISVAFLPATFWHEVAAEMAPGELAPSMRRVVVGGERVHPERVAEWRKAAAPAARLCNAYGPTESTVLTTHHEVRRRRSRLADLPIGRPVPGRRVHVVDRGLDAVPAGVAGELAVAGPGLARGYLALPRLTAAAFVPDPFSYDGARLYRTGDLARWRGDGELDYLGRIDLQVKVRGYRVEPGEVELVLRACEGVREAVVIAREEPPAGLVAFLVGGQDVRVPELRRRLARELPGYMMPAAFVVLDSLPTTQSGKVARAVLATGRFRAAGGEEGDRERVRPRTPAEEILAGIWCRVLGREAVSVHDNFFHLGGHSLSATQVVARIRESFRVEVPLRRLFELPTLAELAASLAGAPAGELPPIPRIPRGELLPPSFSQRRLWFLGELEPHSRAYNMPEVWELHGPLDAAALESALLALLRRHEILNAAFPAPAGEPRLRLSRPPKRALPFVDLNGLPPRKRRGEARQLARIEAFRRFDLSRGPLLRAALAHLDAESHVLLLVAHHILFDGWSWGIFHRELALLHDSLSAPEPAKLPPLPIQYADFAAWQRETFAGERLRAHWAYWRSQLAGVPEALELPTDRPRPALQSHRGAVLPVALGEELSSRLRRTSLEHGATLFMTLLAGFLALLGRHSGQRDVVVGSPVAGRNHPLLERLIGFFVNNLVLRGRPDGRARFLDFLEEVRETALQAYSHQDLPFETLVERLVPERDMSRHRLFQAAFALQNAPFSELSLSHLTTRYLRLGRATARFDVELHLWESEGSLEGHLTYNTDIFEETTLKRFGRHFENLLRAAVEAPERRLGELPALGAAERHQLAVEWAAGPAGGSGPFVHRLFEACARRHPERTAVECGKAEAWSYRELDERANDLARRLPALGARPGDPVAVCSSPGPEMIAAVLAVLKAGSAYLPLDPRYPAGLVSLILEDARPSVLLLGPAQGRRLPPHVLAAKPVLLREALRGRAEQPPAVTIPPEGAAYVIYTSGSTGRPKGVVVSHRSLAASTRARLGYYPREDGPSRFLLASSVAFDSSVAGIFGTLSEGGTLVLVPEGDHGDPRRLGARIEDRQVTRLLCIPALYDQLLTESPSARLRSLRSVIVAGEACPAELVDRHHRRVPWATLDNEYGPTEATVWASVHRCRRRETAPVPIGRPVAGVRARVLDGRLEPSPLGVPGELYLGGPGLARGYFRLPRRTAERFLPDPLDDGDGPGSRLYRTGDRARYLPGGLLELLGRTDSQVKIRGYRVEPPQIETVLRRHPRVADAAVVARRSESGPTLAAFVVAEERMENEPADEEAQREHVTHWRALYEDLYEHSVPQEAAFDTAGWISSYTGEPIPREEMREWIDTTCGRIRELCRPRRVLEIGCGTGLIALRLAGDCESYTACDFSRAALDALARSLAAAGTASHVRLLCRAADRTEGMEPRSFDTVILNSVCQYFPSAGYLRRVLERAVELAAPGGRVFVGDVRNLELLACFHLSLELDGAADSTSVEELLRLAEERRLRERELVVDPGFFHAFAHDAERVSRVRLLPKAGRARNELVRFRYDAILELDGGAPAEPAVEPRWLDARKDPVTPATLREHLSERIPALGLRRVPDPRVAADVQLFRMRTAELVVGNVAELRRALKLQGPEAGIEPDDLAVLAREAGYAAELHLGRAGTYDALLRRRDVPAAAFEGARSSSGPWNAFANHPLQELHRRRLVPELRSYLKLHLPEPMTPSTLVLLAALPRTPNGKVDLRALRSLAFREAPRTAAPAPADRRRLAASYVPPRTDTERDVAEIWSEVLQLERVGIHDDFFELGGHSLLATQVTSRIRRAMAVELPLRGLFEAPTVARLAVRLEDARRAGARLDAPSILPAPRHSPLPLSFAQERLWFLHQLEGDAATYHAPAAWQLDGPLDLAAFLHALDAVGRRHETLRTALQSREENPRQVIEAASKVRPLLVDWTRVPSGERRGLIERFFARELHRPFDLRRAPLVRLYLLRLTEYRHVFLSVFHHVIFDGWSQGIFERELGAAYRACREPAAPGLPELAVQYADFAVWQRKWLAGGALELQLGYWRDRLGDGREAPFEIPADRPRPARPAFRGAVVATALPAGSTSRLRAFSLEAGASLFMTLLAAFLALGHRLTHRQRIEVGTPIANRTRQEVEGLIGFFVNSLVLDADLGGRPPSFSLLLARVREAALGAYAHQDLPFEKLVEELAPARDLARHPLFQVVFALHNAPYCQLTLPQLKVRPLECEIERARFDMEWFFWEAGEGLEGSVRYDRALYDATSVHRLARQFGEILRDALDRSEETIDRLSLLGAAERHQLQTEWNDTARRFPARSFPERFAEQVLRRAEEPAVVHGRDVLTYRALDERSERLAAYLRDLGVGPEVRVGVLLERSVDLAVALVAVWKAGGAYVPLDPEHPASRLELMARDAGTQVLVVHRETAGRLATGRRVDLDRDAASIAGAAPRPFAPPRPESLAYLAYTSGSTGEPKGVAVSHRALAGFLAAMGEVPGLAAGDVLLSVTTVSFDIFVLELFLPLFTGARVVIADRSPTRDGERLAALVESSEATVMQATPATWKLLLDAGWPGRPGLKILCGGEALPRPLAESLGPLWNLYGPTEATVWTTRRRVTSAPSDAVVPIGRPLQNTRLHVVDRRLALLPPGAPGEIVLGGLGLARGYHHRPGATAERFVPNPLDQTPGARLYRTGDLGTRLGDGDVRFLGRLDRQVKVRGVRVEPGEVEAVLASHPRVREAVVVAGDAEDLVAWLVPAEVPGEASRHTERWRSLWEELYRDAEPGDLTGWRSSADGRPIPEPEMAEWLDGTVGTLLALRPRRVLEVGCGTGRVLFRVAPTTERYAATDVSASVLKTLRTELARRGDLPQVELHELSAEDLRRLDGEFDTVVMSSVVQYFPSIDFLTDVLGEAVRLTSPGGTIYVGDVRSLPLQEAFAASVEPAGGETDPEELRRRIRRRVRSEPELLVDPAFFVHLRRKWPRIGTVRVEPRPGRCANELTRFRYDVTLRLDRPPAAPAPDGHDWTALGLDLKTLEDRLAEERPSVWRVCRIPNRRLETENRLLARLAGEEVPEDAGADPEDVRRLGRRHGYEVELSWAEGRRDGSYDAVFHRPDAEPPAAEPPEPRPWSAYGNDPCRPAELRQALRELRTLLAERLPAALWPASLGWIDAIPVTPHGKVDRTALRRRPSAEGFRSADEGSRKPPRGRVEECLAGVFQDLLGVGDVCAGDDFFALGGHSLLITQATSRIRDRLGVEVPVRLFFEAPTVEGLARRIEGRLEPDDAVVPMPRPHRLPLSWPQRRHWERDHANPGNPAFHIPVALRIRGPLSAEVLQRALDEVQRRHEALRTTFPIVDGEPCQAIAPEPLSTVGLVDLSCLPPAPRESEARRRQRLDARDPFDLARGPLLRGRLLCLASEDHVLLLELHHVAFDAWSIEILLRETFELYAAFHEGRPSPLQRLALQYADFTLWQRRRLDGEVGRTELAWWRERLAGPLPLLELPTDRPRRTGSRRRGEEVVRVLDPGFTGDLRRLGRELDATLFMVLLTGYKIVLSRLSGQDDVLVGIPIAGRSRGELEGLIGYFVNNLALRTDLSGAPPFAEALQRVRESTLGALAHQEIPLERIRKEAAPGLAFRAFFNMLNVPSAPLELAGAVLEPLPAPEVWSKFDLTLHVSEEGAGGGVRWDLVYDAGLFDRERMEDFVDQLELVLREAVASPSQSSLRMP